MVYQKPEIKVSPNTRHSDIQMKSAKCSGGSEH